METKNIKAIVSILELVRQLEERSTNPETLDKKTLAKCAAILRGRGYSNVEISDFLKVDERTVQRYMKKMRLEIALNLDDNFQKELAAEIMNNARQQSQRLLRLSHSNDISTYEEARIVFMSNQIMLAGVMLLEKLGYLYKEIGINQLTMGGNSVSETKLREALGRNLIYAKKLTQDQKRRIIGYYFFRMQNSPNKEEEIRRDIDDLVFSFVGESERYKALTGKPAEESVAL